MVDDRWENRSVIVNLLQPLGFKLTEADNGQAGFDQAIATQPDLIITDLMMPVLDGFQMLRQLRQRPEFAALPIVVSSASVFETDQYKSFDAGATAFLPKPVDAEQLLALVHQHLNLEWQYEAQPETAVEAMILPPRDVLDRFVQFVQQGDLAGILEAANQLNQSQPEFAAFAQTVIDLAESFQLAQLENLILHRN